MGTRKSGHPYLACSPSDPALDKVVDDLWINGTINYLFVHSIQFHADFLNSSFWGEAVLEDHRLHIFLSQWKTFYFKILYVSHKDQSYLQAVVNRPQGAL